MSVAETRPGCPARRHGDESAYSSYRCRCPDATEAPLLIDSLGTARRLQALAALGWSRAALAARLGMDKSQVGNLRARRWATVTTRTAALVAKVYGELFWTPGSSARVREFAAQMGWAPPLAWENIDNPDEAPNTGGTPRNRIVLSDVDHLEAGGCHITEIARRMGVTPESIRTARSKQQKVSRTEQREVA